MASTRRDFPEDVLLDILSRLPVKSLKRFQCVCKSWYDHLRSPYFVTQHLHFHRKNRLNNRFLVSHDICHQTCLTLLNLKDSTDDIISFSWVNIYAEGYAEILGPCNGIYCLIDRNLKIALLNVSSREFKALPDHPPRSVPLWLRRGVYFLRKIVEFAFDPKTNDYKVVSFTSIFSCPPDRKVYKFQVAVYSLNSNSWSEVKVSKMQLDHTLIIQGTSQNDTYLDGNVHVLACNYQGDGSYFILSFNLATHVFRKIKLPELLRNGLNISTHTHIGAYDGSLTLMVYPWEQDDNGRLRRIRLYKFVDIWVMQDYDIDESWTKQFRFGPILDDARILGSWRNGQFVMKTRHKFVLYDPSNQKIKELCDNTRQIWYWGQTCIYSESLVSLRGDEGNEKNMLFDIVEDHPLFVNPSTNEIEDCVSQGVWESYLEDVEVEEEDDDDEEEDDEEDEWY